MLVKALGKEWDVNDCTYIQRRELHALNSKVWWDGQDVDAYYKLLEKVGDVAGLGEDDFKDTSMSEIDQILQAIFISYLGLSKKAAGE